MISARKSAVGRFLIGAAVIMSGCGMDLTNKKFREEKDQRLDAQHELRANQFENQLIVEMLNNVIQTANYQWAFVSSKYGWPIESVFDAEALCQKVGFDLPNREAMNEEGLSIPAIKSMKVADIPIEDMVFIKGSSDSRFGYLVCSRPL